DRGLQVGREKRPDLPYGRRVRIDQRARRAGRVEDARERGGDAAEAQPRRAALQRLERRRRLVRADGGRAAAAVDEHEAGEVPGAGLAVEVPGGIGGGDGATERMAAPHDYATAPLRRLDHAPQILDLDAHPPLTCEPNVRIRNELEVRRDARVGEPAEVVV